MKILVINQGSSSIKCSLYSCEQEPTTLDKPIWQGCLEWKNDFKDISLHIQTRKVHKNIQIQSKSHPLSILTEYLWKGETAVVQSKGEIDAIGHRIVHGGNYFQHSVRIDPDVKYKIEQTSKLAPLHNQQELGNVEMLEKLFPSTPQIAVFDTAFHHTLPKAAQIYPGPYKWYQENIKRYGFHGISYQYCLSAAAPFISKTHKMIICHLGSGASLAAIKDGKCIDTTMGFTPLEGLMMDTRSGTIDPGIIFHLLEKKSPEKLIKELYFESGLLGLSGTSSDMRDILQGYIQKDERCSLAFEVYIHRLNALIGSMIASLEGLDTLIFTAGIGENVPLVRAKVAKAFSFLGLTLDPKKNETPIASDTEISANDSKIKVLVIHTQEGLEIARECWRHRGI